jgi:hypothetical protein
LTLSNHVNILYFLPGGNKGSIPGGRASGQHGPKLETLPAPYTLSGDGPLTGFSSAGDDVPDGAEAAPGRLSRR